MPSPFPGMDPYVELHWLDVHARLITYFVDSLNQSLPPDLAATSEERIAVEVDDVARRDFKSDVRVMERDQDSGSVAESATTATVALAPYRLLEESLDDPETEHFVRIVEINGDCQISVIELVSPTNKRGDGAVAFRARRQMFLESGVSVVDIDLVRAGNWLRLLQPAHCPEELRSTYRVTYRLPREPGVVFYKPISLREHLPTIVVPLRENDPEVSLNLQELVKRVYDGGRYARRLDYATPLPVPLSQDDEQWADTLLKAAGKRP